MRMRQVTARRLNGIRHDAEAHARAQGEGGGVLVVCIDCGAIIKSSVLDEERHRPGCPEACIHGVGLDDDCWECGVEEEANILSRRLQ